MDTLLRIYLIGLGAIGSMYAGKIQEYCPENLKIAVDSQRAERYIRSGITINGETVGFNFVQPAEICETADLIIIAVKQHHLRQTISDIRKLVGPDTIILSLLNGISSEEIIGREYGMEKLLYSYCVGTDATRLDTHTNYTNLGKIVFGDKTNLQLSPKVKAVAKLFDKTHIPYSIPENMLREQWWKFMMNVGINQVSAVLRAPYSVFTKPGYARELMFAASREVIELSQKVGINLDESELEKYAKVFETLSPHGKTSMLQDVEAGRKTEVDIFAGTVSEMGLQYGIKTPVNDLLYKIIKAIEEVASLA